MHLSCHCVMRWGEISHRWRVVIALARGFDLAEIQLDDAIRHSIIVIIMADHDDDFPLLF